MSRISRNVLYNLGGQLVLLGLSLVAVRFVFRQVGGDGLGLILFTLNLNLLVVAVLEMGISSVVVREVAANLSGDRPYVRELARTAATFYWSGFVLLAAIVYALAPVLVGHWIQLRSLEAETATSVLRVLGVTAALALPRALYTALVRGTERMGFINLIDVATAGLQQLGTIVLLALGAGLRPVAQWMGLCFVLSILAYLAVCARLLGRDALLPGYSSAVVRRNRGFAAHLGSMSLASLVLTNLDNVVLSRLLSLASFGYYTTTTAMVSRVSALSASVTQSVFPSISALFQAGRHGTLLTQYRKMQELILYAVAVPMMGVIFAVPPLYAVIFDSGVAARMLLPSALLGVGTYLNVTLAPPTMVALAMGRPDIPARLNLLALVVVLPILPVAVLVGGITGAAIWWITYQVWGYAYLVPRVCRHCLRIPVREWYLIYLGRSLPLIALTYGLAWGLAFALAGLSPYWWSLGYLAATVLFLLGTLRNIGPELRTTIHGFSPRLLAWP